MPTADTRISLCGSLEVALGGRRIEAELRGTHGRLLLAYLVLHRDRPVRRGELEAALWEERRPGASDALASPLSRLRGVVGADRLIGRNELRLELGPDAWVDVEAAVRLTAGARDLLEDDPAQARDAARQAADLLSRGLLPGLDANWVDGHRSRLLEVRVEALELAAAAGVRLPSSEAASAERSARLAVELAPFRESAWIVLIDVLRSRANVAEGLRAFEEVRTLLRDALGAAPGPALRAAHTALLQLETRADDPRSSTPRASRMRPLPRPPNPPIGREPEVGAVSDLMLRKDVRLVTLTGPGGIGKSTLALEVGDKISGRFDAGVCFVDLAPVSAPELVMETIAAELGLRPQGTHPLAAAVKDHLQARELLLVMDNFEQVSAAGVRVAELLAAAPAVKVLATSRTVLRISGEHPFPVPALSVPAGTEESDAVRLFVERARAANPAFRLTQGNAPAVAEICRRLDGLPLAIELAGARARLFAPDALLEQLGAWSSLLGAGPRDAPERQRTLDRTITWSYDLLAPGEQALLERLAVFAGGFDLDAAAQVGEEAPVIDRLSVLVDQSLVRAQLHDGSRFDLLQTVRAYARERALASGRWHSACERHAEHYLAFAEAAEPELRGPGQAEWLRRLELEHDNLRAAMSWFLERDEVESAVRLGWAIWRFWWLNGHLDEGARQFSEILTRAERLPPYARARAWCGAAFQLLNRGELVEAGTLFERSLAVFVEIGDRPGIAISAGALGHTAVLRGDLVRGEQLLDESLELYRELDDDWFRALMLNFRGRIPFSRGDLDQAAARFSESLHLSRGVGDTLPLLAALYNLALTLERRGDFADATPLCVEGLTLAAQVADQGSVACFLGRLAAIAAAAEDHEGAGRLTAAATSQLEAAGGAWLESYSAAASEVPASQAGDPHPARSSRPAVALDDAVESALRWAAQAGQSR